MGRTVCFRTWQNEADIWQGSKDQSSEERASEIHRLSVENLRLRKALALAHAALVNLSSHIQKLMENANDSTKQSKSLAKTSRKSPHVRALHNLTLRTIAKGRKTS
jgi:hypothetical protein